jgi:predicted Zn-dependent peptidase
VAKLVVVVPATGRVVVVADHMNEGDVRRTELDSGLRVVTDHMPHAQSVCMGVYARVGSRDEPQALAGASHFLEHLLFKGTDTRSAHQIATEVDAVGGEMNAYTSRETTAYYTRLPPDAAGDGLDLLCDVVSRPAFRPAEVDAEREVILDELLMADDDPDDVVYRLLWEGLYGEHPLGRETLGSPETIEAITRDQIAGFHAERYRLPELVVAVAGVVDHDAVVAQVSACLADPGDGRPPVTAARVRPEMTPVALSVVQRPTEQVHLTMGWPSLDAYDDDRYALLVGNHVLGGGMASRLFQSVREERGLAYAVGSSTSRYSDAGALVVSAGTAPGRLDELCEVIDAEIERLLVDGVSDAERERAIGYLVGATRLGLEDTGSRMLRLAGEELVWGRVATIEEQLDRLRAVTTDDVHKVLHRVLDAPRAIAAVGPVDADHPALAGAAAWRR